MAYSIKFREEVLRHIEKGHSVYQTAKLFAVSTCAIGLWQKKQAAGCLEDVVRQRNFKKIDPVKLEAYVKEHPDAYLTELAAEFNCATSSIHEALTKLGLVRKKKTKRYGEQDKKSRNFQRSHKSTSS